MISKGNYMAGDRPYLEAETKAKDEPVLVIYVHEPVLEIS